VASARYGGSLLSGVRERRVNDRGARPRALLAGHVALVTGATRGLGPEIARGHEAPLPRLVASGALAYHYQQMGDAEKALVYLTVSACKAAARFAAVEASRYYEDVAACLDELPPSDDRQRQRVALRLEQVDMLWVRGRYQQGQRLLKEVERLAGELDDLEWLAQIHFKSGWYDYDQMDLDSAFAHHQACLALCEKLGIVADMRRVYWGLGNSCRAVSGDPNERRARAIEFHRTGLELLAPEATPGIHDVHNAHFLWLLHLLQRGDWPTAMTFLQRGEEICRRLPEGADTVHLALMKGSIGLSHLLKRKTQAYLDMLAESLETAERAGSHIYTTISHYLLGQGHFLVGDLAMALTHFETTLGIAEQTRNLFLPGVLLWTAETQARLDRPGDALDSLRRYEAVVEAVGPCEGLAWFPSSGVCHRVYGLVFAATGEPARAAREFEQSGALLSAHGYRPDLARTLAAFGEMRRQQGHRAEARDLLTCAVTSFREMEFTYELDRTLALLAATTDRD
jgi:tetratricopeptide (TPR) repeat protein